MTGISGGGGGQAAAGLNPGPNQVFQPPNQGGAANQFQGLNNQLYNLGWSGYNALPGGITAGAQLYPQVQQAGANFYYPDPSLAGSYGSYGSTALGGALSAEQQATDPNGLLAQLYGNAGGALGTGYGALGQAYGAAYDPGFTGAITSIENNPYFTGALSGAETGAGIGGATAGGVSPEISSLIEAAMGLGPAGGSTSQTTNQAVPTLSSLLLGQAQEGTNFAAGAQSLNPQLAQLYQQTVPSLEGLASGLPAQTGAIGAGAQNLYSSLAPGIGATGTNLVSGLEPINQNLQGKSQNLNRQLSGVYNQTIPGIESAASGISGIGNRGGYGLGAMPAAGREILNVGQDPQNQLFNKLTQQQTEQSNAVNSMSGLGSSPYGAGLTSQNLQNFDINWQNQQLQRQATADQAATGLFGQTAQNAATKAGIQAQGAGVLQEGGALANAILGQKSNINLGANAQEASNLIAGGGLNLQASQALANLGLGTNQAQLNATLGGATGAGNLLQQGGVLGSGITSGALSNVLGASNIYNQQAQGAGALGSTIGGLESSALNQLISGQGGTSNQLLSALGLGGGAAGLATSSAAGPSNAYQGLNQAVLSALSQRNQASAQGAGALTALTGQQGQAGAMGAGSLQSQAQFANLPYQTSLGQAQNAMTGATNQANFGNQLLTPAQQAINNLESYLGLGQSSSQIGGNLSALDSLIGQQNQPNYGALGSLLNTGIGGGALGSLLYGSGGLSGALGLNPSTGLLGSFGGSPISATVAGPTAPSGLLGFLGNPFGSIFG